MYPYNFYNPRYHTNSYGRGNTLRQSIMNQPSYQQSNQQQNYGASQNLLKQGGKKSVSSSQSEFIDISSFYMVNVPENWNGFIAMVRSPDIGYLNNYCHQMENVIRTMSSDDALCMIIWDQAKEDMFLFRYIYEVDLLVKFMLDSEFTIFLGNQNTGQRNELSKFGIAGYNCQEITKRLKNTIFGFRLHKSDYPKGIWYLQFESADIFFNATLGIEVI
jgi:hypothetical protein